MTKHGWEPDTFRSDGTAVPLVVPEAEVWPSAPPSRCRIFATALDFGLILYQRKDEDETSFAIPAHAIGRVLDVKLRIYRHAGFERISDDAV
jgi:hypothetical protein